MRLSSISDVQEGVLLNQYAGSLKAGDGVFVVEPLNPQRHDDELSTVREAVIVRGNEDGGYPEYVRTGDEEEYRHSRSSRNPIAFLTQAEAAQALREDPATAKIIGNSILALNAEAIDHLRTAEGTRAQVARVLTEVVIRRYAAVLAF